MSLLKRQLTAMVKFLTALGIDYAIIGGLAVSLYGRPRFTADIDVNIILEKERIGIFLKEGKKRGFHPGHKNIKMLARKTGVIPMRYSNGNIEGLCDFIIAENVLEKLALKRAKVKRIDSLKAKFVSPEDLLIHKLTSPRAQDIEDVRGILLRQRGKLNISYIKFWLGRIDKANRRSNLLGLFRGILAR